MEKRRSSPTMALARRDPTKYKLKEGVQPEDVLRLLHGEDIGIYRRLLEQLVRDRGGDARLSSTD